MQYRSGKEEWLAQINGFGGPNKARFIWWFMHWFADVMSGGALAADSPLADLVEQAKKNDKLLDRIVPGLFVCSDGYVTFQGPSGPEASVLRVLLSK